MSAMINRSLRSLVRYAAAAIVVGTATFGIVRADDDDQQQIYSCCGNTSEPGTARCRYTDRAVKCNYDSTCASNTGFTICCENGCSKYVTEEELE